MSTPRTDAELEDARNVALEWETRPNPKTQDDPPLVVSADFARQLERELEEARLKAADRYEWQDVALKVSKERDRLQSQLTAAKAALEKAREALNAQKHTMHAMGFDCIPVESALTAINEVLK